MTTSKASGTNQETETLSKRQLKAKTIHRNILNAARSLISELGYEKATITKIRKKADVSIATFYNYFESKQSVLLGLLADERELTAEAIDRMIDMPSDDPVVYLSNIILGALHPENEAIDIHMWREILAASLLLPEEHDRIEGLESERSFYSQQMLRAFDKMINSQQLSPDCPTEQVASIIYCISAHEFQEYVGGHFATREELVLHLRDLIGALLKPWILN